MIFDLNGRRLSLTSASADFFNGYRMLGCSELKLNEKLEPGELEGTSSVPAGYTTGPWSGTGGFKVGLKEGVDGLKNVGGGFGGKIISATWNFTELLGDGSVTIYIPAARITSPDFDGGDRSKPSMLGIEFKLLEPCLWDGVKIIEDPSLVAGLGGFVLSALGGI